MNRLNGTQETFLNTVRGLSAFAVLAGHTFSGVQGDFTFGKIYPWQSFAVVVFFWLSGFLIAYNCLTRTNYGWSDYMADRFSRIYVLYIPALLFTALAAQLISGSWPTARTFAANLVMLQHTPFTRIDEALPTFPILGLNSPLWTVAIEWWLYVLFGAVFFSGKLSARASMLAVPLLVVAVFVCGYFLLKEYVAWTWMAGALASAIFVYRNPSGSRVPVLLLAVLSGTAAVLRFDVIALPGITVNMYDLQLMMATAVFLTCCLILCRDLPNPRALALVAGQVAFASYALYLFHEPIRQLIFPYLLARGSRTMITWREALAVIAVCFAICWVVAYFLEEKHLDLRRWIKQALARRLGAPAAADAPVKPA